MVEDVCPLYGAGQNRPLPPLLPHHIQIKVISSMVVLAQHGEVAKAFPVARLDTNKLPVSIDAIVGLELLATILAYKYMVNLLPNLVLVTEIYMGEPSRSCDLYFCAPPVISSSQTSV